MWLILNCFAQKCAVSFCGALLYSGPASPEPIVALTEACVTPWYIHPQLHVRRTVILCGKSRMTKQHATFNDLRPPEWLPEAHASADLGMASIKSILTTAKSHDPYRLYWILS